MIESERTNPPEHCGTPLTPRHHAALRLLVRGHGSDRVARYLGVERHTIARWKRNPLFAAELTRMTQNLQIKVTRVRPTSFIAQQLHLADPADTDRAISDLRRSRRNLQPPMISPCKNDL